MGELSFLMARYASKEQDNVNIYDDFWKAALVFYRFLRPDSVRSTPAASRPSTPFSFLQSFQEMPQHRNVSCCHSSS